MPQIKDFVDHVLDKRMEKERDAFQSSLESFDSYKERTKSECLKSIDRYSAAVQRGYELIMQELSEKYK